MNTYTFQSKDKKYEITVSAKNYPAALDELTIEKFRKKISEKTKMLCIGWTSPLWEAKKLIKKDEGQFELF